MTAGLRTSLHHHNSFKTTLIKPQQTNKTRNKTQETSQQNFSKSTTEFTTRSFAPQNNGSIYLLAYCSKLRTSYVNFSPSCSCSSVKSFTIFTLLSDFFYLAFLTLGPFTSPSWWIDDSFPILGSELVFNWLDLVHFWLLGLILWFICWLYLQNSPRKCAVPFPAKTLQKTSGPLYFTGLSAFILL